MIDVRALDDAALETIAHADLNAIGRGVCTVDDCMSARVERLLRWVRRWEATHPHLPTFDEKTLPAMETCEGNWFVTCRDLISAHVERVKRECEKRMVGYALARRIPGSA